MNIYESMNKAFDKALKESLGKVKSTKKVNLRESASVWDKLCKAYPELGKPSQVNRRVERAEKANLREDVSMWSKLCKAYPELGECDQVNEGVEKRGSKKGVDLWDEIYSKLTMSGDIEPAGKSTKFGTGAGYSYVDQVWVGADGEICVGAESLEELRPAADIATRYAERGVQYDLRKCSKRSKYPYCIMICVPEEEIKDI